MNRFDFTPYRRSTVGFDRLFDLLESKGVEFEEYDITLGGPKRTEMLARKPDARTVPQIFIDDRPIGGFDQLYALERSGGLDPLLNPAA